MTHSIDPQVRSFAAATYVALKNAHEAGNDESVRRIIDNLAAYAGEEEIIKESFRRESRMKDGNA